MVKFFRKKQLPQTTETAVSRARTVEYKQQVKDYEQRLKELKEKQASSKSISNRISNKVGRGLSVLQRGGVTRRLYRQPVSPYGSNIRNYPSLKRTGRRGRPVGTVKYRDQNGNPIGVYEYRRLQRQMFAMQRQRSAINPQQRMILEQIERRRQMQQQNPERQVIPDTNGGVFMADFMNEINQASNIFG